MQCVRGVLLCPAGPWAAGKAHQREPGHDCALGGGCSRSPGMEAGQASTSMAQLSHNDMFCLVHRLRAGAGCRPLTTTGSPLLPCSLAGVSWNQYDAQHLMRVRSVRRIAGSMRRSPFVCVCVCLCVCVCVCE